MKRESHLGVYALIEVRGSIALILKSRGPYTGSWDLPGGKIEFGESPVEALTREVQEEVGLRLSSATLVDALSVRVDFKDEFGEAVELHHLGVIFVCEVAEPGKLSHAGDDEDASEARWITLIEARELALTPFARIKITKNAEQGGGVGGGDSAVLRASS